MSPDVSWATGRINLADPGGRPRPPRSKRFLVIVLAVLVVAGAVAGVVLARRPLAAAASGAWGAVSDWSSSLRSTAATVPEPITTTTTAPAPPPPSRSVLITFGDTTGSAGFALLVQDPEGPPQLIIVPQSLLVQVPGFGEFSAAQALGFGGPDLAELSLANELGIRIDDRVDVPPGGLAEVAAGFVVDVPVELFVSDADGSRRLIAAGTQRLSADLVELLLVEQGEGDVFEWLLRQEAVWSGLLDAAAADPAVGAGLAAGAGDPVAATEMLAAIVSSGSVETLPLDRVSIGAGESAFVLATERYAAFRSGALGHLVIGEEIRPRVEILNGNGVAGSGIPLAEILVAEGFYVFRSGNADRFDHEVSLVIAQGEDAVAAAQRAAEALGIGQVLLEGTAPSGVVDVSIIVATDLAPKEG